MVFFQKLLLIVIFKLLGIFKLCFDYYADKIGTSDVKIYGN